MEVWQSPEVSELAAAIVKAQKAMKPAAKDCTNPFFKSKYADLASVWAALMPFTDNNIAITQSPMSSTDHVVIDTQLTHGGSGQWMRSRLVMPVPKNDPQGYGSALTYARRYALGCMTGLVTEDDDDGNAASKPVQKKAPVAVTPPSAMGERQEDGTGSDLREKSDRTQPSSDAPAPYIIKIGRQKNQPVNKLTPENLEWVWNYYLDKIRDNPNSRYREEWEEAVLAIQEVRDRQA